jgi:phospho-N-acetylmuramoyl-pentapeptide-transferase
VGSELWQRLALVCAAGGVGLLVSLLAGTLFVPLFVRRMFVSREAKEGVAKGRQDIVPMGGGFILLAGASAVVLTFGALHEIRKGYAACFLILFWGFGLLGYLDDCSKAARHGYGDRLKVLLQVTVTMVFAVAFYLYGLYKVPESDLGIVTLPFIGELGLKVGYVAFVMVFLFWVSNAVNITDGFNGLAGGTGAVVALAYVAVTFLSGVNALALGGPQSLTAARMFALSLISAGIGGSLIAYLYYNFHRGSIYFGDTGSMALGGALAFLALFSRTEFLLLVIGGVFFAEAASVFLQKTWIAACKKLVDPLMLARMEPTRPFVIAPLHHHFEHLILREVEAAGGDESAERPAVRRRLTLLAWAWSAGFALVGVLAQWGRMPGQERLYDWLCVLGVAAIGVLLGIGVATRFLYDCYFIGPNGAGSDTLTLYRGVPLRLGRWRLFTVYQRTGIPLERLGYLERRTGLFRLFFSRVDARTAFGLLHFGCAAGLAGDARAQALAQALSFWGQVPRNRFLAAARQDVLLHMAQCHRELGASADAVECLEELYSGTGSPDAVGLIEEISQQALAAAEADWATRDATSREACRASHGQLLRLLRFRHERARRVLERLAPDDAERAAVAAQVASLEAALPLIAERCRVLETGS